MVRTRFHIKSHSIICSWYLHDRWYLCALFYIFLESTACGFTSACWLYRVTKESLCIWWLQYKKHFCVLVLQGDQKVSVTWLLQYKKHFRVLVVQGDQKVSVHLIIAVQKPLLRVGCTGWPKSICAPDYCSTKNTSACWLYRVTQKSLCTWWLQYWNTQKYFKQFQSLSTIT
jgi:hypothetical protein